MHKIKRYNGAVDLFMNDLTSRVVAKTGIPSDRFHLGKLIFQSFQDAPNFVLQIDGSTGESQTNASILKRSIQCARAMTAMGLKKGDVIMIASRTNLDVGIPFYAAMYVGVTVATVDWTMTSKEYEGMLLINKPKIIFCLNEKTDDIKTALSRCNLDCTIITLDESNCLKLNDFLETQDGTTETFSCENFDPEDTMSCLTPTSGTTGLPKSAMITHKNLACNLPYFWIQCSEFPTPTRLYLLVSPMQWLTAIIKLILTAILRYTMLLTPLTLTVEHTHYLINKYKPTALLTSPTFLSTIIQPKTSENCDFSCFEYIWIGGSTVDEKIVRTMQKLAPNGCVHDAYGMTEAAGVILPVASKALPSPIFQIRLVDPDTNEDITECNKPGEMWLKGPSIFKGYFNNPEATKEALTEDGWLKTGDLFYRDEHWYFYFIERIKLLLKYRNHQVSPAELENLIRTHPAVMDVAVGGIPDLECGELPAALIVPRGPTITAQEIQDLVKGSLTDSKQLRGGVIFVDKLPLTPSNKIDRKKVKKILLQHKK